MKIVIVGGVAGGATAAARIRRLDEEAEIIDNSLVMFLKDIYLILLLSLFHFPVFAIRNNLSHHRK